MAEKFNFTTKLYEACAKDEIRPIYNCVHFQSGFAYASNGIIIVKQSLALHSILEPKELDGKSLHADSYKNIMQFESATANQDGISCSDKDGRVAFFEYFDRKGENIPDFDTIINKFSAKSVEFIGLTLEQIKMVINSFYIPSGVARLNFGGIDKGIYIDVPGVEDQMAILMPALIEPTLF